MSTENKGSGNSAEPMIWVDMEMSGLKPDSDRILEIAMIVTDAHLNIIATAPVWVVHQANEVLGSMDAWNTGTHTKSGLVDKVRASDLDEGGGGGAMYRFSKAIRQSQYCADVR